MLNVAVLVGSLRRDSSNRKFAKALEKLAAGKLSFVYPNLDLPLYNEDLWENPLPDVMALKEAVESADGVLFVTPEYNRSLPPVIKNAIDWGSRPWGQNSWDGKPVGIVGLSPGAIGTAAAQVHLRSIMPTQGAIVLGKPEVYFSQPGLIEEDGTIDSDETAAFLTSYIDALARFIEQVRPKG